MSKTRKLRDPNVLIARRRAGGAHRAMRDELRQAELGAETRVFAMEKTAGVEVRCFYCDAAVEDDMVICWSCWDNDLQVPRAEEPDCE